MDGAPTPVMRGKKQKPGRWDTKEKVFTATENLREMRRIAVKMLAPFLLGFCEVMGVPSGLQTAFLTAQAARGESLLWPLCGCVLSFVMRALWGLPLNWGTLAGWGLTLLTPALLFHKGLTRLMLFTLLALLPLNELLTVMLTGVDRARE